MSKHILLIAKKELKNERKQEEANLLCLHHNYAHKTIIEQSQCLEANRTQLEATQRSLEASQYKTKGAIENPLAGCLSACSK